jgi:hypothetical protein
MLTGAIAELDRPRSTARPLAWGREKPRSPSAARFEPGRGCGGPIEPLVPLHLPVQIRSPAPGHPVSLVKAAAPRLPSPSPSGPSSFPLSPESCRGPDSRLTVSFSLGGAPAAIAARSLPPSQRGGWRRLELLSSPSPSSYRRWLDKATAAT